VRTGPAVRQRRHTQYFLDTIRVVAPVFLDTDVDMTNVQRHRAEHPGHSIVSYVAYACGRVLATHPEANAALRGLPWRRLARYDTVNAKITLDKSLAGQRIVLATVVPGVDTADLDEIQRQISHFRDGDAALMPEFAAVRLLHRLPRPVGVLLFRSTLWPLSRRAQLLGTVAITSLGHRPVNGFHSVGGTTITLGLGQITDRPVVRDAEVSIAPMMRLNLAFDHRIIDGAEAADVLTDIKDRLESFSDPDPGPADTNQIRGSVPAGKS